MDNKTPRTGEYAPLIGGGQGRAPSENERAAWAWLRVIGWLLLIAAAAGLACIMAGCGGGGSSASKSPTPGGNDSGGGDSNNPPAREEVTDLATMAGAYDSTLSYNLDISDTYLSITGVTINGDGTITIHSGYPDLIVPMDMTAPDAFQGLGRFHATDSVFRLFFDDDGVTFGAGLESQGRIVTGWVLEPQSNG